MNKMRWALAPVLASLLIGVAPGAAFPADVGADSPLQVLRPDEVDPARLLPPPVADEGAQQQAELADVKRVYGARTADELKAAQWDNDHEDPSAFYEVMGPGFDLAKLPATAKLLSAVFNDQAVAAGKAKRFFHRRRPWAADTSIVPCDFKPNAKTNTSYPSGHSTMGFALGYVLAALAPDKAQAILIRARDYSFNREVCGDHYPSDLDAGHTLGTAVAVEVLSHPEGKAMFDAAQAELRAAGFTAAH